MQASRLVLLVLLVVFCANTSGVLQSAFSGGEFPQLKRGAARTRHSGYPGYKGHKTVLFRRNGQEITTADDLFQLGGQDFQEMARRGATGPPMLNSTEDFPSLQSTKPLHTASADFPTAWHGRQSTLAKATWAEPAVVGLSGGGGQLQDESQPVAVDVWPPSINVKLVLHAGPKGDLPLLGCSWDPKEKRWREVEVAKTAATDAMQFTLRIMKRSDIVAMKPINFACRYTEQFPRAYYDKYMATWPDLCLAMECNAEGELGGYVLGKVEMGPEGLYGHISALTVKADCRRRGVAQRLMSQVELVCAEKHGALYVDLFVKTSNKKAQQFYQRLGYVTYRVIKGYYDDGDALDMRKSLPADRNNRRMAPMGR